MLFNCGAGENSRESPGLQGDQTSQSFPEYSLEGLTLKLKLQSSGHLMQRANLLEKILMLGKTEGRRRGQQRMRWLGGITDSMAMNLSKERQGSLTSCSQWVHEESDVTERWNNNWLL